MGWVCVLAMAAAFGLGGCRTVEGLRTKPVVQSVAVTVGAFDPRAINLRFDVELLNPGDGEMNVAGYDYELQIEGQPFTTGASQDGFRLAPRGTARVPVPVAIALADLQRMLAAFKSRGEVSYRLAVTLRIDTLVGAFRFPLTKDGCVSVFPPSTHSCREPR
ncbi:MAG TPA: LEA type 2 family protein [Nitrospiraceae bacterium]|nr:LEA type 2 family protein [Nitrospiraceae bacterium]